MKKTALGLLGALVAASLVVSFPAAGRAAGKFDIVVVGGTGVVSDATFDQLTGLTSGTVTRLAGASRFETAAAISQAGFDPGVPVVYVANGLGFPDALAAAPVAALQGGPLLLVTPDSIPTATSRELTRLTPARIVVVGGSGVIADSVRTALGSYTTGAVDRLWGPDRYATAAAISASHFTPGVPAVFVAVGTNFPDALAASAKAGHDGGPILLTAGSTLPGSTRAELTRLNPQRIYVVGGSGVIADSVLAELGAYTAGPVERLAGANRYATATAISAATFNPGVKTVYIGTGLNFPDALAAGAVAGGGASKPALGAGPILLVGRGVPSEVAAELQRLGANNPPVADSQTVTLDEDTSAPVTLTATDADGDPLTFTVLTGPSHGDVTGTVPDLTYTPQPNFNGSDSFTFRVGDGVADSATAVVSITVDPVPDPPVPADDTYDTVGNTTLTVASVDPGSGVFFSGSVLANDADPDGDPLTVTANSTPAHGALVMAADGTFEYRPDVGYTGGDGFTYDVTDGTTTVQATVTLTVSGMVWYFDNTAPAGGDGTLDAPFGSLFAAEAASTAGDTLFAFAGDGTSTGTAGVTLKDGQHLVGEATGLTMNSHVVVPAGARPMIGYVLTLGADNLLDGLGFAVADTSISGADVGNLTIANTTVDAAASFAPGVDLTSTGGAITVTADTTLATSSPYYPALRMQGTFDLDYSGAISGGVTLQNAIGTHTFGPTSVVDGPVDVTGSITTFSMTGAGAVERMILTDPAGSFAVGSGLTLTGLWVQGNTPGYNPTVNVAAAITGTDQVRITGVDGAVDVTGALDISGSGYCLYVADSGGTYSFTGGGTLACTTAGIQVIGGTASIDAGGTLAITGSSAGIQTSNAGGTLTTGANVSVSGATYSAINLTGTGGVSVTVAGSVSEISPGRAVTAYNTDADLDVTGPITSTTTDDAIYVLGSSGTYRLLGGGSLSGSTNETVAFFSSSGTLALDGVWSISGSNTAVRVSSATGALTLGPSVSIQQTTGTGLAAGGTGTITVDGPLTQTGAGTAIVLGESPTLVVNGPITATDAAVLAGSSSATATFNGAISVTGTTTGAMSVYGTGAAVFNGPVDVMVTGPGIIMSGLTQVTFAAVTVATDGGTGLTIDGVASFDLTDPVNSTLSSTGASPLFLRNVGIPAAGMVFDNLTATGPSTGAGLSVSGVTGGTITIANLTIAGYATGVSVGTYGPNDDLVLSNLTVTATNSALQLVDGGVTVAGGTYTGPGTSYLANSTAGAVISIAGAVFDNSASSAEITRITLNDTTNLDIADSMFLAGSGATNGMTVLAYAGANSVTMSNSTLTGTGATWGLSVLAYGTGTNGVVLTNNSLAGYIAVDAQTLTGSSMCLAATGNVKTTGGVHGRDFDLHGDGTLGISQASLADLSTANNGMSAFQYSGTTSFGCTP